jgi:hypothetical protein
VSYALGDNVERLVLTGSGAINAVGNAGNNRLEGNAGNNILFGGLGNDTYVFGRGSGHDIVANYDAGKPSGDKVQLAEGVVDADLRLARRGNDLLVRLGDGGSDELTVLNYFVNGGKGSNALEKIRFADGAFLNHAAVLARALPEAAPAGAIPLPAMLSAGDPSSLYSPANPAATGASDGASAGAQSISEAIAQARTRFEQGLRMLREHPDASSAATRGESVQASALPLLWNLQDALLDVQLSKNGGGRFSADMSLDSRIARDLGLSIDVLSAVPGAAGRRLDQVSRPEQVSQFSLAEFH